MACGADGINIGEISHIYDEEKRIENTRRDDDESLNSFHEKFSFSTSRFWMMGRCDEAMRDV